MGLEERRSLATVNAGTHEVRGDLITIHPLVAKTPAMMDLAPARFIVSESEAGLSRRGRCGMRAALL